MTGRGDLRVGNTRVVELLPTGELHEVMKIENGEKIGLNIWARDDIQF